MHSYAYETGGLGGSNCHFWAKMLDFRGSDEEILGQETSAPLNETGPIRHYAYMYVCIVDLSSILEDRLRYISLMFVLKNTFRIPTEGVGVLFSFFPFCTENLPME